MWGIHIKVSIYYANVSEIKHLPLTVKYFLGSLCKFWWLRYERSSELHRRSKNELEEQIDRPWVRHCTLTTVCGCWCGKITVPVKLASMQMQWLLYFYIWFLLWAVWQWRLIIVTFCFSATKEQLKIQYFGKFFFWWWWWFSAKKAIRHTPAKKLSWMSLYQLLQSHRLNGFALINEWIYSIGLGVSGWST